MARISLNDLPKPKWMLEREVEIMAWGRGDPIIKWRHWLMCPNCGDDIAVREEPKGTFCAECGLKLETCCEGAPIPSKPADDEQLEEALVYRRRPYERDLF